MDFFAGCLGGCAGVLVGYPLDTIKVSGLYKGMSSPLAGVAFVNAIVFGVYGNVQRRLSSPDSLLSISLAGAVAGIAQSIISCPMELVKLRLQIQDDVVKQSSLSPRAKIIIQRYKNPWDCTYKIYNKEGIRGLFRGFGITTCREAPAFGIYFASYEWLLSCFQNLTSNSQPPGAFPILLAGGLSGIFSWVFTYPIDVVKTRLQADGEKSERQYRNTLDCFAKSYQTEGFSVFTRGLLSTVVRAFPTNAATFVVVSWTFRLLSNKSTTLQDSRLIEDHKRLLQEGKKFEDMKSISDFNTIIA